MVVILSEDSPVEQAIRAERRQDLKERRFSIAVLMRVGGFKPPLLEATRRSMLP
jgi:hypothetical protein